MSTLLTTVFQTVRSDSRGKLFWYERTIKFSIESGISIQIGYGVKTDRLLNQTVEFEDLSQACILDPDTCTQGATLVMWLHLTDCPIEAGIMSSHGGTQNGFRLVCGADNIK